MFQKIKISECTQLLKLFFELMKNAYSSFTEKEMADFFKSVLKNAATRSKR